MVRSNNGMKILVHAEINTVSLGKKRLNSLLRTERAVKGQPIMKAYHNTIKNAQLSPMIIMLY